MDRRSFLITSSLMSLTPLFAEAKQKKLFITENVVQPKDISDLKEYLKKMSEPDKVHPSDIFVNFYDIEIFNSVHSKLLKSQKNMGFGNFTVASMKDIFKTVDFSEKEKEYMISLFNFPAPKYGFYGEKPIDNFWNEFEDRKFVKVNGVLVLDGSPIKKYQKLVSDINNAYMTSGIRNIGKQMLLFVDKAKTDCKYNLSMASRSLAPAGYSYHGVGDFDIGQKGFEDKNFTDKFAETEVFRAAVEKGYITIRYERDNLLGVRYEPWHVKV